MGSRIGDLPPGEGDDLEGSTPRKKTLVFCTAYTGTAANPWDAWNIRYKRWLEAITTSHLHYDQILIVDDGSPTLPEWPGMATLFSLGGQQPEEPVVLFHFAENLGRLGPYDYPGWFRSFALAAVYAQTYGFEKVIHIESDAFLISRRIQDYCNAVEDGWVAFLCPRYNFPETGIQIMAGTGLRRFYRLAAQPYSDFARQPIETALPFTRVERRFIGDRYGDYLTYVPAEADWTMQACFPSAPSDDYYWWMHRTAGKKGGAMYRKENEWHWVSTMASCLRFPFAGADAITENYSQAWQDIFVLSILEGMRGGCYLEVGGQAPVLCNNTYLLHKQYGWSGVTLELDPVYFPQWQQQRPQSTLIIADALMIDYADALPRWFAAARGRIDYLQLDIDPSPNTLAVLKRLPLDTYRFSVITFETDAYAGDHRARDESRDILTRYGYELIARDVSVLFAPVSLEPIPFEDWWVDPLVVDRNMIGAIQALNENTRLPRKLMFQIGP